MRHTLHALTLVVFLLGSSAVSFAQTPSLNWGSEVNPARCPTDQGYRYLEINVTRKIEMDVAPGSNNFALTLPTGASTDRWALREFNQHVQVWKIGVSGGGGGGVGAERYCALVRYQGSFEATGLTAPSPGALQPGVDGTFEGGYRLVFNADEAYQESIRGHVELGTVSAADWTGWIERYFTNIGVVATPGIPAPEWWGWVYHGGHNGTWVNSIAGVQGNITGAP